MAKPAASRGSSWIRASRASSGGILRASLGSPWPPGLPALPLPHAFPYGTGQPAGGRTNVLRRPSTMHFPLVKILWWTTVCFICRNITLWLSAKQGTPAELGASVDLLIYLSSLCLPSLIIIEIRRHLYISSQWTFEGARNVGCSHISPA